MFKGVDYSFSRPNLSILRDVGIVFISRYLCYLPSTKAINFSEKTAIINSGFFLSLNWENKAGDMLGGYMAGKSHAAEGMRQALLLGYPTGCTIFHSADTYDFTVPGSTQNLMFEYLRGCRDIYLSRYKLGLYGGYGAVKAVLDRGLADVGWQTYAWSGGRWDPRALVRQTLNNQPLAGGTVDYDEGDPVSAGMMMPLCKGC